MLVILEVELENESENELWIYIPEIKNVKRSYQPVINTQTLMDQHLIDGLRLHALTPFVFNPDRSRSEMAWTWSLLQL